MKKILLPAIFLIFIFSGCTTHQYVFVEGQEDLPTLKEYSVENDSIEIFYDFSGMNVPVNIMVKNKSNKPLYIDWNKSAAIIDGKKYGYWDAASTIELSGTSDFFFNASGTIQADERVTFIPPHSYIETTRMFLQTAFFEQLPEENKQRFTMQSEKGPVPVNRYSFSLEDSPLTFRSLLTLSSNESFSKESHFEQSFWVSEIIECHSSTLFGIAENRARTRRVNNTSIISKKSEIGKTAEVITAVGVITGTLMLSKEENVE